VGGRRRLSASWQTCRRVGGRCSRSSLDRLAEALLGTGDLAAAEARARGRVVARRSSGAVRCSSRASSRARQPRARVEQLLEESVVYIEETGAKALVPVLDEARAELERAGGDSAAAGRELREARRLYAEMGATGHAERLAREAAVSGPSGYARAASRARGLA
jgi:hypothetical protein